MVIIMNFSRFISGFMSLHHGLHVGNGNNQNYNLTTREDY